MRIAGMVVVALLASCLSTAQYEQAHQQRVAVIDSRYEAERTEVSSRWNELLRQTDELKKYLVAVSDGDGYKPVDRVDVTAGPTEIRMECVREKNELDTQAVANPDFVEVVKKCCDTYYRDVYGPALRSHYFRADVDWVLAHYSDGADIESLFAFSHNAAIKAEINQQREMIIAHRDAAIASLRLAESREVELSAEQRDVDIERAREEHRQKMQIVAAALQGMAQAQQPTPQRSYSSSGSTSLSKTCSSDFDCGMGHTCLKPNGLIQGQCAISVNEYGNQVFELPRMDSVGINRLDMSCMRHGCPVAFRCDLGTGACLR